MFLDRVETTLKRRDLGKFMMPKINRKKLKTFQGDIFVRIINTVLYIVAQNFTLLLSSNDKLLTQFIAIAIIDRIRIKNQNHYNHL